MEFHHISWKWGDFTPFSAPWGENGARAAPGQKHQRNLCFSYAFLGVPGTQKLVSGWISTKKQFRVLFFSENHQNWWNSAEFHHFHSFSSFWAFPAARAPRKAWNLHVLSRFWQGPPGTGGNADFICFTMISHNFTKIMILHEFLGFLVIFMILHENHENWDPPAPGRRNSMYYCTISHDMGSSFRWIPTIFMFFHEIH